MQNMQTIEEQQQHLKNQQLQFHDKDLGQIGKIENQLRFNSEQAVMT